MKYLSIGDPKFGIRVYKNAIKTSFPVVETIDSFINNTQDTPLFWSKAMVGYNQEMPDYRNCWDCKLHPHFVESLKETYNRFKTMYSELVLSIALCVDEYTKSYNFNVAYMEAVNFVKYGVGDHFDVHADHGYSYTCTVSSVAYLNDNYEGGELWFDRLEQKIKPEAGDIVIFPSTFIYSHASLPVKSGIKYSAVTMFDYNDTNHGEGGYAKKRNSPNPI